MLGICIGPSCTVRKGESGSETFFRASSYTIWDECSVGRLSRAVTDHQTVWDDSVSGLLQQQQQKNDPCDLFLGLEILQSIENTLPAVQQDPERLEAQFEPSGKVQSPRCVGQTAPVCTSD